MKVEIFIYDDVGDVSAFGVKLYDRDIKLACETLDLKMSEVEHFIGEDGVEMIVECAFDFSYCQFCIYHDKLGFVGDDLTFEEFSSVLNLGYLNRKENKNV